jgi:hypothetical protein
MTSCFLAVVLAAVPAADARVKFTIDLAVVRITLKEGRTVVYQVPAPAPVNAPVADPPTPMAPAGAKFSQADVDRLVKTLQSGAMPAELKTKPVMPQAGPAVRVYVGRRAIAVEVGKYELLIEVALP